MVLDFDKSTTAASTLKLDLSGGITSINTITMNNSAQVLEIGPSTTLTITVAETFFDGTVRMAGGTIVDAKGITLGNQGVSGTIVGFGTIAADITGGGTKTSVNTVTASGGTLVLTGAFDQGKAALVAAINSTVVSDLKFDGTATVGTAALPGTIAINSAFQTLEIGALGALTITGQEIVTNGTIRMDGGSLTDTAGLVIDTAATLIGKGLITAGTTLSGDGTVKASGGTLELGSDLTAATLSTSFQIDSVNGSVLRIDGAVEPQVTLDFLGDTGVLELMDVVGGVLQGFDGRIAGFGVARECDRPDEPNLHKCPGHQRGAVGQHDNGVQWYHHRRHARADRIPVHGAYAMVQVDATLGGSVTYFSATNRPRHRSAWSWRRPATAASRATASLTRRAIDLRHRRGRRTLSLCSLAERRSAPPRLAPTATGRPRPPRWPKAPTPSPPRSPTRSAISPPPPPR